MDAGRRWLLGGIAALPALGMPVWARDFPDKPIRLVIPFPGGFTDTLARMVGEKMSEQLGQPVIVDQKPGGSGQIGAADVLRSPADGHTLFLMHIGTHAVNPHLFRKLSYDADKDFIPVTELARVPNLLVVSPSLPVRTVAELVALAKSRSEPLFFASPGNGSSGHLAGELLKAQAGAAQFSHVAYKGASETVADLSTGRVHLMFDTLAQGAQLAKAGKVRALAVTSRARHPILPDTPTMVESGYPDWETGPWFGLAVKAGTPAPVVARLHAVASSAVQQVGERLTAMGALPVGSSPEQFSEMVRVESRRWGRLVQELGLKAE